MNATEDTLQSYLTHFHKTLDETANQFLRPEHRSSLFHLSLLPARINAYVSTQFGVAIEYTPAAQTEIVVVRGSARVEDLLVQAPRNVSNSRPMFIVQEGPAGYNNSNQLANGTIANAFPFRLAGPNSNLRIDELTFKIGPWNRNIKYAEIFGNRTREFWSQEQAISRAKDEVLAALATLKRADARDMSLHEYVGKFKERTVLILGDYGDAGLQRLARISEVLIAHGYDPILISDIRDQPVQDLPQKVVTVGSLARFVIVDDSSKTGHIMEVELCKKNNWITVLLRKNDGEGASWMTAGASIASNVILEHSYEDENISASVSHAIKWSEEKIAELELKFNSLYPWRNA